MDDSRCNFRRHYHRQAGIGQHKSVGAARPTAVAEIVWRFLHQGLDMAALTANRHLRAEENQGTPTIDPNFFVRPEKLPLKFRYRQAHIGSRLPPITTPSSTAEP